MKKLSTASGLILLILISLMLPSLAQDLISDGYTVLDTVGEESFNPSYSFEANAGDQVTVTTRSFLPGMVPEFTVTHSDGTLAFAATAQTPSTTSETMSITHRIFRDDTYTISLTGQNGFFGNFLLAFNKRQPQDANPLAPNAGVQVTLSPEPTLFFFYPDAETEQTLCIHTTSPGFGFGGQLYNEQGIEIASLNNDLPKVIYTIPALDPPSPQHFYEVELFATKPDTIGDVILGLNTCDATTQLDATTTTNTVSIPTTIPSGNTATTEPTQAVTEPATQAPQPDATTLAPGGCPDDDGDGTCDDEDKCPQEAGPAEFSGCINLDGDAFYGEDDKCEWATGQFEGCPDTDSDGVHDGDDACGIDPHDTPTGCPEDDPDGDGVLNDNDTCPDEFGTTADGCPEGDRDGDGVLDNDDDCPDQAGIQTDELQSNGCPDPDGDGFVDEACPDEPGTAGGCPDADGDFVADAWDDCPNQAGIPNDGVYPDGCPDSDGDRVFDPVDNCPDEAGIRYESVNANGCPDSDDDGRPDRADSCPDTPGTLSGCPDDDGDGFIDAPSDGALTGDECIGTPGTIAGCPDSDGDGRIDENDDCPNAADNALFDDGVYPDGCPDDDGDGFYFDIGTNHELYDRCPAAAGSLNGCPDTDGDGIHDFIDDDIDGDGRTNPNDACTNTPGTVVGCPDADGDGFGEAPMPPENTFYDQCPGVYGENQGCPPDSDGDGTADSSDQCPNVPGDVTNKGCPLSDRDGDGVPDDQDLCPDEPADPLVVGRTNGCPQ